MSRVLVKIEEVDVKNEGKSGTTRGVRASCTECDNVCDAFGTSAASIKRACAGLRDSCPEEAENFYVPEDDA